MSDAIGIDALRAIDLFDEIGDAELAAWAAAARPCAWADGETVQAQGDRVDRLYLFLEGRVATLVTDDAGRQERFTTQLAPTWSGAIGLILDETSGAEMRADGAVTGAVVPAAEAIDLMFAQRPVLMKVLRQVRPLSRRAAQREQNRERLEALGTMSAGLAHELNNPAAAAKRAAAALGEAFDDVAAALGNFVEGGVSREHAGTLVALQREAAEAVVARGPLGALDAADAEDALSDLLDDHDVPDAWRLVEPLAAAGVDAAWVERVVDAAGPATPAALRWIAATLTASGLISELTDSTDRMSTLVGAIKSYSYMDRGELNEVDLHEGLETTLVVLKHKLKHTAIEVVRDYDTTLPRVTVHGSELNQVWTNLLDNAIDALGQEGTITLTTRRDGSCVEVEVADDGPGIADDVLQRIFEPFFTTKAVGSGTGLGLDSARRIVAERHRGSIRAVTPDGGGAAFVVRLPIVDAAR